MKRYLAKVYAILLALLFLLQACELDNLSLNNVDQPSNVVDKSSLNYENYVVQPPYVKNQMIVIYKDLRYKTTVASNIKSIIPDAKPVRTCSNCDGYVELWQGTDIHTIIHGPGITSTRGSTRGSGEDGSAYYSRNFETRLPHDILPLSPNLGGGNTPNPSLAGKPKVIIAVLDTGIKPGYITDSQLWKNPGIMDISCYPSGIRGWNFVDNNSTIGDNHTGLHGTLVSQYIVNQFNNIESFDPQPVNNVQIMNLKTHDSNGIGRLFNTICAIRFAKRHGAKIINASWGMHFYQIEGHAYLKYLITQELRQARILFFAAAGNTSSAITERDVSRNYFYPAYLSDLDNNVITVTTTDGIKLISPTQNYSNIRVDLGVKADRVTIDSMLFRIPFSNPVDYISGSSFATPIAAGKIGAFLPFSWYPPTSKQTLLNYLQGITGPGAIRIVIQNSVLRSYIREGRYIVKNKKRSE